MMARSLSAQLFGIFLLNIASFSWATPISSELSHPSSPPSRITQVVPHRPPHHILTSNPPPSENSHQLRAGPCSEPEDDPTETLAASAVEFNVLDYGAVGDGATNDDQAFQAAWTAACAVDSGYVHAPAGYIFKVYPILFQGPCATSFIFKVDGNLLAPKDPAVWANYSNYWLQFKKVSMTLQGVGTIDGQGQTWWADSCKTNKSNPCVDGPTAIVFQSCTNVTVKHVVIQNSQQMHLAFEKSSGILVNNVTISAPGTSPNTDGIHLQNSSQVAIKNTLIGTGDDCISIQTGSFNVHIRNVQCGPGHGIRYLPVNALNDSIGRANIRCLQGTNRESCCPSSVSEAFGINANHLSCLNSSESCSIESVGGLGKKNATAQLSGLVVESVVFNNATNGVRIKTWQGSSGYANNFTFKNINMVNTKNPILIDQYYCDSGSSGSCPNYTSNVVVSNIQYKNITGTSGTKAAVAIRCSETVACTGISLSDIDILQTSGSAATSSCVDAYGAASGTEIPASCLIT